MPPGTRPPLASPNSLTGAERGASKATVQALLVQDGTASGYLPIYANANINAALFGVQRAVIVLHDDGRDAAFQAQTGLDAVAKAGGTVRVDTTLVVSLLFAEDDAALPTGFTQKPALLWSDNGYMAGFDATSGGQVSSFAAVDTLLQQFSQIKRYPALQSVFVIGHSAGGQTTDRYAIGGKEAQRYASADPNLYFAIANPSSYAYFDPNRPTTSDQFAPFDAKSCAAFDTWKYGIKDMPRYFTASSGAALLKSYFSRNVAHLLGTDDTDAASTSIDRSCCAEAQGEARFGRGQHYMAYLGRFGTNKLHSWCQVPGVGHDTAAMLTSDCLLNILRR